MNKKTENLEKCEFLLSIDNNIICQRYFNVKWFNKKSLHSINLYWEIEEIHYDIIDNLKKKTTDYFNNFRVDDMTDLREEEQYFTITIKHENKVIHKRIFRADYYPPKIRYTVDIRPQISSYLRGLTDVLSYKNPVLNYQDYQLSSAR